MQSTCFFFYSLARIDKTEETKRALHEGDVDSRHSFLCMVLRVFLLLPGEKELDCFSRKASKGRFLLLFCICFLFATSMRPTKTL